MENSRRKTPHSYRNCSNCAQGPKYHAYPYLPFSGQQPINRCYFNKLISQFGYDTLYYPSSAQYWTFTPKDTSTTQVKPFEYKLKKDSNVPNVRGMIASDAIAEIQRAGYKVSISGRGVVTEQTVDNGQKLVRLKLGT